MLRTLLKDMIKIHQNNRIVLTPKGQKIVAAVFLVTGHLSETDPMREKLRVMAVSLVDCTENDLTDHCATMAALIQSSHYAGLISEGNAKIIEAELKYFSDPVYRNDTLVSSLFPSPMTHSLGKGHISDKKTSISDMSYIHKTQEKKVSDTGFIHNDINKEKKDKRQEKILSYVNDRKSASIKDIAALFPDVSEKTIQRELGILVAGGKITKRGNKRWSLYLSNGS
jgi:hypothetical protein